MKRIVYLVSLMLFRMPSTQTESSVYRFRPGDAGFFRTPSMEANKKLVEDNKQLRERVENLESIVCSVDFELNQKLAKVIDEQRSVAQIPASDKKPAALDDEWRSRRNRL